MEPFKLESAEVSMDVNNKLEKVSQRVNDVLVEFQEENPEITAGLLMKNQSIDIGLWVSMVHKHFFRDKRYETLRILQQCMEAGMEAGVKAWDKAPGDGK